MNWTRKPWNRVLKNGLVVSSDSADKDADFEEYTFKDEIGESIFGSDQPVGGVDVIRYSNATPFNYWSVEFWGKYKELQFMFAEKYNVEYESMEAAQIAVDAFLDKMFDLKVFL